VWALKGLVGYIARAAARLRPDAVIVGFDCPEESVRKRSYPGYKAHRPAKAPDLIEQLFAAPELLRATGLATVVVTAHEADDVLASASALATQAGWRAVLVTSDRDAFALLSPSTDVLRVRNGGLDEAELVTAETLPDVCGVLPGQYRDFAALRGDPSDNLPGVRGFGSATAARLLAEFGSVEAAWGASFEAVRAVVGEHAARNLLAEPAREIVARNRSLMRMVADLPLPELATTRLPLSLPTMRAALATRGIVLGPSLWALTGGAPPVEESASAEEIVFLRQPWVWRRSARRVPAPGQLALF
jgi:DNA polymerase-1